MKPRMRRDERWWVGVQAAVLGTPEHRRATSSYSFPRPWAREEVQRGGLGTQAWRPCPVPPLSPQRIAAVSMPQALSYFGRSVDGRLDLDGDDLVDVAVGAQGAAVLLR